jgi:putative colanic acid biosynthesis acetyltransferase WcaF
MLLRAIQRFGRLPRLMTNEEFRRLIGARRCAEGWRLLGAKIDQSAHIHPKVSMRDPGNVTIGAGCKLAGAVILDSWFPITLAPSVLINQAELLTGSHDFDSPGWELTGGPINIGEHAWLIRGVTVLPNLSIGKYAVVATRAVVTKDVADYAVVAGNPATVIKERARFSLSQGASPVGPQGQIG